MNQHEEYSKKEKIFEELELTDEENAALKNKIPMTQEIYDSIFEKCIDGGHWGISKEYPDLTKNYLDRFEEEFKDIEIVKLSKEENQKHLQRLLDKIKEEYGEDAI